MPNPNTRLRWLDGHTTDIFLDDPQATEVVVPDDQQIHHNFHSTDRVEGGLDVFEEEPEAI